MVRRWRISRSHARRSSSADGQTRVSFKLINFFRYNDEGRLAEEWAQMDNCGLLKQFGVKVPGP